MTTYDYNDRMAALCVRADRVCCALGDSALADVYELASLGFSSRASTLPLEEARKPIDEQRVTRLRKMEEWVTEREEKAAWLSRGKV